MVQHPIVKGATARTTKRMKTAAAVQAYQKEWFLNLQDKVKQGEPCVFINGDSPFTEIFQAMNITTIVNAWWGAIISAKRLTGYYHDIAEKQALEQFGPMYSRLGQCGQCGGRMTQVLHQDPEFAPYGGLPKLAAIVSPREGCQGTGKASDLLVREYQRRGFDVPVFNMESSATTPYYPRYPRWWEKINEHWDEVVEPYRVDYVVEEMKELIKFLEVTTGKTFNQERLLEVLELANEQEMYWRQARDLIAGTIPCPVALVDHLSNYPAQWHRGTPQGRDFARMFYEEVKEIIARGEAVCPGEKLRLRWVKTGFWADTAFYQYFEEKYGAVFVCSWYLSIASDGYARYPINGDPLRAIASRQVFLGLYAGPGWDIKEAKLHQCNGAVMVKAVCPNDGVARELNRQAFEAAGIPMLLIDPEAGSEGIRAALSNFIEKRLLV